MKPVSNLVLLSVLFLSFSARADFLQRFNANSSATRDRVPPVSLTAKQFAAEHTVVFVGGLSADLNPTFVSKDIEALKSLGVKTHVVKLQPKSEISISQNALILYRKLRTISEKSHTKLVVLAHSKGGVEALLGLLWNIKYYLGTDGDFIESLVTIQAPLKGAKLAEIGKVVCGGTQLIRDIFGWWDGLCNNFDMISRDGVAQLFDRVSENLTDLEIQKLNERVFFVRSHVDPSKLPFPISLAGAHLATFGKNDGIVMTREMKRDEFGTDLGMVEADHFDLISGDGAPITREDLKKRFVSALLNELVDLRNWKP